MNTKIDNDFILRQLRENFNEEIYLVGGSVRDFLNNEQCHDRDIVVVNADVKKFSQDVAKFFEATFIELDKENEIYRIVLKDKINYIDITKPQNGNIEDDLRLRDLTINSIAVNLKTAEILDVTGGKKDFENKILRVFEEKSIIDDPLRILRIFRFMAIYDFSIEECTREFIVKHKSLLNLPAIERINYEILRLFSGRYAHKALLMMDELGILEDLFPFVREYKKVPPNTHHHLDLFHHLVETVRQLQLLYENAKPEVQEHLENFDFGAHSRLAHLKFAGFLHDIGKFSTWTIDEAGRHRFIKHDDVGAKIAQTILKKNKFSKKQIAYIAEMIKYHIYPSGVMSAPEVNDKIMMRFVRKMADNAIDVITLAKADRLSALGEAITQDIVENNLASLDKLQEFYLSQRNAIVLPILLNGNEIMEILNITPSKKLGDIISALKEEQLNSNILTRDEAVEFVKKFKE